MEWPINRTQLGLAHGPGIVPFARSHRDLVDYVELPFEQLRHTPEVGTVQEHIPVLLHCASLSIAGFVFPSDDTVESVRAAAARTGTPWIGEHLAFLSADGLPEPGNACEPTNLTFTVCPQLSDETVERVAMNLVRVRSLFDVPIIVENSPQYFDVPGSHMSLVDFVAAVAERCDVDLLLDLSHLMITSLNTHVDVFREVERLPLERVVEVHLSGFSEQSGIVWDDHATPVPEQMFSLLERVLERVRPRAVTIEYNWAALPESLIHSHLVRTRSILDR